MISQEEEEEEEDDRQGQFTSEQPTVCYIHYIGRKKKMKRTCNADYLMSKIPLTLSNLFCLKKRINHKHVA